MNKNTKINCPDCGSQIDVNELLKHQLEESLRNEFKQKQVAFVETQKQKQIDFQKQIADFELEKIKSKKLLEEKIEEERKVVTQSIEKKLRDQLTSENEGRLKSMQNELAEKSEKVKELFKKEAEIERLKGEGFKMIHEKPKKGADNKLIAFLHPKSTNAVLIELCQDIED